MKVVILTGSEIRHNFFRKSIAQNSQISVIASYCEGKELSLENRLKGSVDTSDLQIQHVNSRSQSEKDFFFQYIQNSEDSSSPKFITKGEINSNDVVTEIISLAPDLLVCYGTSLIKSRLLEIYAGKFLNVHLGLSPYYRGSGTNTWPLINNQPDMVGATFMHIDKGIDTGKIIHQIRADIFLGDGPHAIGNRLIQKMTETYADIIINFHDLDDPPQLKEDGKLYKRKDFNHNACKLLYENFSNGMIQNFLNNKPNYNKIIENKKLIK